MALSTTGDFIRPPGTESILKFGKVNLVITAKKCEKNDPKTTWKLINYLIGGASKTKHVNEIEIDDKIIRNDENISEAFNEFFIINIGPKLASEISNQSTNKVETYLENNKSTQSNITQASYSPEYITPTQQITS